MIRRLFGLVVVLIVAGCKSRPLGPYVSPRVTGQVLAADTGRPLAHVNVTRGSAETAARSGSPPKGAELMIRKVPVQTDREGRFLLSSERVLSVVRGAGWDVVSVSFDGIGYRHFQTNCPIGPATNLATGEPVLDVGRVFLQPALRR